MARDLKPWNSRPISMAIQPYLLKVVKRIVFSIRVEFILKGAADVVQVLDLFLPFNESSRGCVLGFGLRHLLSLVLSGVSCEMFVLCLCVLFEITSTARTG